ncbi:PREDICTED: zinc finger protein 318-like [Gekko japonicus]|uniref:Zinc finger protein 318-like n=1 Tax=Gekko japonicus TaxID=146911 RepID=A0ABM1JKK0_GEKJA|nr:PREDICTED: zinc finger protein 318-like [Gekko japonicus]
MYRSSSGRSSLSSSSRSKESSSSGSRTSRSGASTSGPTRGRSPRRSPSPRGRSPSPRLTSRVGSPSGGSRSRRGSEQRDGSLSKRCSPRRQSCSSQRHSQFPGSCSPSRHSESSVEQNLWTEFNSDVYGIDPRERRRLSDRLSDVDRGYLDEDSVFIRGLSHSRSPEQYRSRQESPSSFSTRYHKDYRGRDAFLHQSDYDMNDDCLEDLPRESDRDGKLFTKSLYPSEEERINPKRLRSDREDRMLDVSTDPRGSLSENRNYYKRRLSSSQMYPDEDPVSSRRNREEEELSKNTFQDCPGGDYVIRGLTNSLQSSESQYLYRPDEAPAMPKKSILKKRVDDPTMQPSEQSFGSFLRKKYQELTSESADPHDDFLLPHERASQDGSGISHILGRMADSTSTQEKRRHSILDVEDEETFLYGDDEDDSNINCPPTEMLTVNGGKESVSLNKRPPSPIPSVKPDNSEGSGIEYEKIHDLLKTIGLDIGVVEIGEGAARTQERLHGKKTLRSIDGLSYKADSSEKDDIQSNTHSSESDCKNSLSPCGSFQPSDDVFSAPIAKHAKTLEYNNSAGPPEQSFPSVSVTPSAPPLPPNLPPPPPPVSQYSLSHFTAFLAAQAMRNYPPPTMPPPSYNAYGHGMAYSASAWPMYPPPQQSNPALPHVRRLESTTVPPQPTKSNLRVIETVSRIKKPENRYKSVLVKVPITPTGSELLSQSSNSGTTERISDGKNPAVEKPQGSKLGKRMPTDEECNEGHGVTVQSGNNSNKTPHGALVLSNLHCKPCQAPSPVSKQKNQQDTMTKADGMRENEPSPMSKQKNQQDTMTKADGMRENAPSPVSKQKNQQDTMTKADGMRENEPSPMSKQKNQQDTMTKADGMRENVSCSLTIQWKQWTTL